MTTYTKFPYRTEFPDSAERGRNSKTLEDALYWARWNVHRVWSETNEYGREGEYICDTATAVVDPGYSLAKVETFLLPVRREGLHVTFRPASYQWNPKPFNDDAITIGGQLFYAGVPEKMRKLTMPPIGSSVEERRKYEEPYNERASHRYRLHAGPDPDGTTRWQNPFAAGSLRSEQLPGSMRNVRRSPIVELVNGKLRPAP